MKKTFEVDLRKKVVLMTDRQCLDFIYELAGRYSASLDPIEDLGVSVYLADCYDRIRNRMMANG